MLNKNRLLGAIVSAGMTQNQVASKIGVSKNTFSAKINGKSCFDTAQVEKIAKSSGLQTR